MSIDRSNRLCPRRTCEQEHMGLSNPFLRNSGARQDTRTHVGLYLSDLRCVVIGQHAMGQSLVDRSIVILAEIIKQWCGLTRYWRGSLSKFFVVSGNNHSTRLKSEGCTRCSSPVVWRQGIQWKMRFVKTWMCFRLRRNCITHRKMFFDSWLYCVVCFFTELGTWYGAYTHW